MKIDVSTIEGFDAMSAEDKVNALLGFEYDNGASALEEANKKIKGLEDKGKLFDKVSSELAQLKKEKRDRMTEDEKAKADSEALVAKLKALEDANARREKVDAVMTAYGKYGMTKESAEKYIDTNDMSIITELIEAHTKAELDKQKDGEADPHAGHNGGGNDNKFKPQTFNKSLDLEGLEKLAIK